MFLNFISFNRYVLRLIFVNIGFKILFHEVSSSFRLSVRIDISPSKIPYQSILLRYISSLPTMPDENG